MPRRPQRDFAPRRSGQRYWLAAALIAATIAAYWPALHAGFVWDDDIMLTNNPLVRAGDGLLRMWFTGQAVDYWPVTGTSFWLEWRLWELNAAGYHVTNVLLHACSALIFWRILRQLEVPAALLAAFVFALHPVNVESVAWIAERKNTLSLVFCLLSASWYLQSDAGKRFDRWYLFSLLAFVAAMLSKGSVAMLPVLLLLMVWWKRNTIRQSDLIKTAPFFAIAGILTLVNIAFQARGGTVIRDATAIERLLGAGAVIWFYAAKAVLPIDLMFIYPNWKVTAAKAFWWLPMVGAFALTAVLFVWRREPRIRAVLFGWMFFCIALVPVMGLTDVYFMRFSLVADHYQYVALLGVCGLLAAAFSRLPSLARRVVACGIVAVLGIATWQQTTMYADSETLYRAILKDNPAAWLAHNNLALRDLRKAPPDTDSAIVHLRAALTAAPGEASLHDNLGSAMFAAGNPEAAIPEHREAIRLAPADPDAYVGLGDDLQRLGRYQEAIEAYQQALSRNPTLTGARANLGAALQAAGQGQQASQQLAQALSTPATSGVDPEVTGNALLQAGQPEAAIVKYREALQRNPGSLNALNNLGFALSLVGRFDEAEGPLRDAVRRNPNHAAAHDNLGNVLRQRQELGAAIAEFQMALKYGSGSELPKIHNDLGIALAMQGRMPDAVREFREALRLQPNFPAAQANLSRALAGK